MHKMRYRLQYEQKKMRVLKSTSSNPKPKWKKPHSKKFTKIGLSNSGGGGVYPDFFAVQRDSF